MKRLLILILALCFAAVCFAGPMQDAHKRVVTGSSGGTVTTFTVQGSDTGEAYAAAAQADLTSVSSGDLIVVYARATISSGNANAITVSDGTDNFTCLTTQESANNETDGRLCYLLSSTATGSVTYTASSTGANFMQIIAYRVTPSQPPVMDQSSGAGGSTLSGTSIPSGNITTTGGGITFAGSFSSAGVSALNINDSAADAYTSTSPAYTSLGYSQMGSTYTGQSDYTAPNWSQYTITAVHFK